MLQNPYPSARSPSYRGKGSSWSMDHTPFKFSFPCPVVYCMITQSLPYSITHLHCQISSVTCFLYDDLLLTDYLTKLAALWPSPLHFVSRCLGRRLTTVHSYKVCTMYLRTAVWWGRPHSPSEVPLVMAESGMDDSGVVSDLRIILHGPMLTLPTYVQKQTTLNATALTYMVNPCFLEVMLRPRD